MNELAARCLSELAGRSQTLATAESLTCGLVAATLAEVPGASQALRGGIAAYATDVKVSVLGISQELIDRAGVVSGECAEAMAHGVRVLLASDWALATTGVAGPDRQEGHRVGTVFVAVVGPAVVRVEALRLTGGRNDIRTSTVQCAFRLLDSSMRRS